MRIFNARMGMRVVLLTISLGGYASSAAAYRPLSGVVTDAETGQPIIGATVLVEPMAAIGGEEGILFPVGLPVLLKTGAAGAYSYVEPISKLPPLLFPRAIPQKHTSVRLVVAKLDGGPPNYKSEERLVLVGAEPTYLRVDFALPRVKKDPNWAYSTHYASFVQGTLRDAATGEGLAGLAVRLSAPYYPWAFGQTFHTDREGRFFGVVGNVPGEPIDPRVQVFVDDPNHTMVPASNGLRYDGSRVYKYGYLYSIEPLRPQQPSTVSIAVSRASTQMAVMGRVTNATTGAPIEYALVTALVTQGGQVTAFHSMTNALGRYQIALLPKETSAGPITSLRVRTNGGFLRYADAAALYQGAKIDLTGRFVDGDIYQQDFSLVPKQ